MEAFPVLADALYSAVSYTDQPCHTKRRLSTPSLKRNVNIFTYDSLFDPLLDFLFTRNHSRPTFESIIRSSDMERVRIVLRTISIGQVGNCRYKFSDISKVRSIFYIP